jgi:hypothetical protein
MKRFNIELIESFYQEGNCFALKILQIGIEANERSLFKFYITNNYIEINLCFFKKIFFN